MSKSRNDIIAEFTREITKLNIGFKQYLQSKMRQNNIDLTFEMLQVLNCLWKLDGINQQEVANITIKDKASMTYVIDNLAKRKLVYREEDSNDRRNKLVYLTKEGKSIQAEIQPLLHEMYLIAGKDIKLDGIPAILLELEKIRGNLRRAAE